MRTPLLKHQAVTTQATIAPESTVDPAVTQLFAGTSFSLFGFLLLIILLA